MKLRPRTSPCDQRRRNTIKNTETCHLAEVENAISALRVREGRRSFAISLERIAAEECPQLAAPSLLEIWKFRAFFGRNLHLIISLQHEPCSKVLQQLSNEGT